MSNEEIYNKVRLTGLTAAEVTASRARHGANTLTPPRRQSLWRLYLEKYEDPIIRILLVAAAISLVLAFVENDFIETIGIILAVFFATTVGFYFERDAARKFDVLTALDEEQPVKVLRNLSYSQGDGSHGSVVEIPRRDVVVGDIVIVETGDEIPADGQLFEAIDMEVDESSLTGELLTTKGARNEERGTRNENRGERIEESLEAGAYPKDILLRSSLVMNGNGRYVVTAVGDHTEIGKVARQATELTAIKTPLNIQLDRLAKLISKVGAAISIFAFLAFLVHDILTQPLWHTTDYLAMAEVVLRYFMMAVTLIVMAVPEGLPMAVTLALALNMRRMLKSNDLVRKLAASETMGAVTVICTDKTGTLTQNRMTVFEMKNEKGEIRNDGSDQTDLYKAIALNTTATHDVGNPTEQALLRWLMEQGVDYQQLRREHPFSHREPFSTERKYMTTTVGDTLYIKGAPEVVLAMCDIPDEERQRVESQLHEWQQRAMRTLAIAVSSPSAVHRSRLLAVVAISDPLREDVAAAVADCHAAGIEVKIVTGDTAATAAEIARQAGILEHSPQTIDYSSSAITGVAFAAMSDEEALAVVRDLKVMSRARPADKQRLVELLQRSGEVVAVTGDGTNDAPALNYAHVGLSLGSGTNVAKNASDITILDDSFRSIVQAVMWGRSLYKNIQRFIFFQLVVNVTALLLVLGGSVIGTELPLTVTQILWVNLIMDTFAAMALASLPPSREFMHQPPRSQTDFIITPSMVRGILGLGILFFVVMFVYLYKIESGGIDIRELTIFFTTFVMLQWWNLLNARTLSSCHSAFRYLFRCRGLLLVLLMILVGQWLIVTFGGTMFRTVPLSPLTWLYIIVATSPVLWLGEVYRLTKRLWTR
jgi:Ca2+-transporting ATPase